jgi:Tol biopolymer transport system component
LTRLTDDPEENLMPVWSPDGAHVAFGRRVGNSRLYWQQADGSGAATPLSDTATSRMPLFFTPDGKQLIFVEQARDVLALSLDGSEKVSPLLVSPARELNAVVSPDGSWTAYAADDTGQFEVFVRPFPDANGGKWQVSRGGGTQPLWSRDGRELYYRDQTGAVLAVPVRLRPSFASGPALKLFEGGAYAGAGNVVQARTYDVSPDGRRFLMIKLSPNRDNELPANYSLVLVQHWFDEVRRLTR